MKFFLMATAAIAWMTSPAFADKVNDVKVFDHTKTVIQSNPITERRCQDVQVPIYQQGGGASGADVLGGMILGGLLGKGATGKDNGAAAGAVLGGIIAADKGNKPRVSGYRLERQCSDITVYQNQEIEVYSHSTIRFYINGQRYVVQFQK
jgi:uncharacterized protein YcfJ